MNYHSLKAKKDGKRLEQKIVKDRIQIVLSEIGLRNLQVQELWIKYDELNDEAQSMADQLLEMEYEATKDIQPNG